MDAEARLQKIIEEIKRTINADIPENMHPLEHTYHVAEKVMRLAEEGIALANTLISAKLKGLRKQLAAKYGPGYIIVKTVRNKLGKPYHYVIYRVLEPERKDIYLSSKDIVKLRDELRWLQRTRKALKEVRRKAWLLSKITKDYVK